MRDTLIQDGQISQRVLGAVLMASLLLAWEMLVPSVPVGMRGGGERVESRLIEVRDIISKTMVLRLDQCESDRGYEEA